MNAIAFIPVKNGRCAIVDFEDMHLAGNVSWYRNRYDGYPFGTTRGTTMSIGRFLLKPSPGLTVDHINGDPYDNRRCNLREATMKQNQQNQGKRLAGSATSKYKGVFWCNNHKAWRAQIRVDGRKFHLGTFKTQEMAAMCYNDAAYRNFGEFARLNVIKQEPVAVAAEQKAIT